MESVLHKHYKIGERLFSNVHGELFLGRDLQATTNQRLLIHYLPSQLLSDQALKQSLSSLQNLGTQADISVLRVLDCAWSDTEVFFVLEAPEAWSLSVLPALQGQPTNLHQKALGITQQLIDQGLVTKGVDPSLFLVTPTGDLYLLGTAFLTELQAIEQQSPTLLQPAPPLPAKRKPSLLPLLLLAGAGLVTAGSLGVYQFVNPAKQTQFAPSVTASELDKPLAHSEVSTNLIAAAEPVLPKPVAAVKIVTLPQTMTPNPQASKQLEHATEAIKNGHLQTGLYYLRLAKKLEASQASLQTAAKKLIEQAQLTSTTSEGISPQMQNSISQEFGLE